MNPETGFTPMPLVEPEREPVDELFLEYLGDCRETIAARYFETSQRLDVRHLWTDGSISAFRVNWWKYDSLTGERWIQRSEFVVVEATLDGMIVCENTRQKAA